MRELRFRAWIPSLNRYATGFDNLYYHRQMNGEGEWWCYPEGEDEPLDVEIEQSTGLKDKNGKEIYEGDIVEYKTCYYGNEKRHHKVVEWEEWDSEDFGEPHNIGYSDLNEYMEVIGNIHEQPELLEAKNVD